MLANYTWDDASDTLLISLSNNENLTVYETVGGNLFELNAGTFTPLGGDSAPGNGTSKITIAAADLSTSVKITNSTVTTGTNNVTFSAAGSLSSGAIAVDITDPDAVGTISSIGFHLASTDTGGITLETRRDIIVAFGAVISTTHGNITLRANQQPIASTDSFVGISIYEGGAITTAGTGTISLEGRGGGTTFPNYGINFPSGKVESVATGSAAGTITLNGTGGLAPSGSYGVVMGGQVTSVDGDIAITGQGGGDGTGSANRGLLLNGASISSTGTGSDAAKIAINGTGGNGIATNSNQGVFAVLSEITTKDGDILITGQHGSGGVGAGSDNFGIQFLYPSITSTGTADIHLISDSINFIPSGPSVQINAGANSVTLQSKTKDGSISINLGGADAAGALGLSDAELDRITAGKLVIGTAEAGPIKVTADITRASVTNVELVSGDSILISGGQVNTGGGTLLLHPGSSPDAVKPTRAGIDATASTVSFGSDLAIAINGTTVDTDYTQLNVAGTVDLTGVDLVRSGSYVPKIGDVFTIVSATSIAGQFDGLADGTRILFNGVSLTVEYSATAVTLYAPRRGPDDIVVLGRDAGAPPRVAIFEAKNGTLIASFEVYNSDFRGGVRVAVADLNQDGIAEVIVAPGAGMSTLVKVFDLNGNELRDYRTKAYAGFSGGVFVAAGDVNGDGRVDIITSPGEGLNSNVKVFKNRVGIGSTNPDPISDNPIYSFLAFDTITRRGATVAAGDLTGDGKAEIVVGNTAGTSPLVRVFDMTDLPSTPQLQLFEPILELRPFSSTDRGGVFVAVGNVRGDATPEIIIGNGANGRGRVEMYSATGSRFKSFTAYGDGEDRNAPVHVSTKNIDADALDEIITGQGAFGSRSRLRTFNSDGSRADEVFEGSDNLRFDFGFFVA